MIAASYLISQLTAGQDMKIIKDLGLAALSIFGLLIAVFIGIGLVTKEVEKRSVFGLLTKPLSRTQFILGKYAGLVMTLAVNLGGHDRGAITRCCITCTSRHGAGARAAWPAPAMDPRLLIAIGLIFAELMLVTALALFFSTFSSPLLATLLTLGLWVAGHFNSDLRNFEHVVDSAGDRRVARGVYYVHPEPRAVRREGGSRPRHADCVRARAATRWPTRRVYITLLLTAAVTIFRRRDFK